MVEQWACDIIGKMHQYKVTALQLSAQIGYHPKYVSAILNGHKCPKNA